MLNLPQEVYDPIPSLTLARAGVRLQPPAANDLSSVARAHRARNASHERAERAAYARVALRARAMRMRDLVEVLAGLRAGTKPSQGAALALAGQLAEDVLEFLRTP